MVPGLNPRSETKPTVRKCRTPPSGSRPEHAVLRQRGQGSWGQVMPGPGYAVSSMLCVFKTLQKLCDKDGGRATTREGRVADHVSSRTSA